MTELIQKAIKKIDGEADKIDNNYVTSLVSKIIDEYLVNDENAEKVLNQNKTLQGCLNSIFENAKKDGVAKISENRAFVGGNDDDLWKWIVDHYGFAVDCKENKVIDLFDFI
ncbi:MAG: hypothetical protein K2L19_01790 [Eubacterium sp.]|nr:hypothetical protein [Eubacterium sp.]